MRYSAVFAGFVALAAAAPIDLPSTGLPTPEVPELPELPELPVDLPLDLPVKRDLGLPKLPVDVPELPELPVDVPALPELPVKRALNVPGLPVDLPALPVDVPALPELPVDVPELPVKREISVDESKVVSIVYSVIELLAELIHVDVDLPQLPELPAGVPANIPALPTKREISVDESKVVQVVYSVIGLLSELIHVDLDLPQLPELPVEVPALPSKRATVTVDEKKVISTVDEVVGLLSQLVNVDVAPVNPPTGSFPTIPQTKRQLPKVPSVAPDADVSGVVNQVIAELTALKGGQ